MSNLQVNQIQHNTAGTAINVIGSGTTSGLGSTGTPTSPTDFTTKLYVDTALTNISKGQIFLENNATSTTLAVNTPTKANGTTSLQSSPSALNFDMPLSNRLRYTGTQNIVAEVNLSCSLFSASANQNIVIYLAKNGVVVGDGFKQEANTVTANFRQNIKSSGMVNLATNDFLELFIENVTGGNAVIVRQMVMFVRAL